MVASVLCGLMYQQSPIRAARRIATSALAPIQIGGVGFCSGFTGHVALSSSKSDPFMVTKSSVHSRRMAVEAFLEAGAKPAARHAERFELDIAVADPGAEHQLAAAQQIERGQLFSQIERLVQRHQHQAADDPQPRRDRGAIGQERDLLHGLERMRAVMRALDDAVEAEPFGASHQFEIVVQVLRGCRRADAGRARSG